MKNIPHKSHNSNKLGCSTFLPVLSKVCIFKVYFSKVCIFKSVYYQKCVFSKCIFQKCVYFQKFVFSKCTCQKCVFLKCIFQKCVNYLLTSMSILTWDKINWKGWRYWIMTKSEKLSALSLFLRSVLNMMQNVSSNLSDFITSFFLFKVLSKI